MFGRVEYHVCHHHHHHHQTILLEIMVLQKGFHFPTLEHNYKERLELVKLMNIISLYQIFSFMSLAFGCQSPKSKIH